MNFVVFLGSFLLLSSFNLSTELNWNMMQKMTDDKVMCNDQFNEILKNLRGFEMGMLFGDGPSPVWCDQKDKLQHFHFLEDWILERSRGLFFPKEVGGCYVLDDELILSKAGDIEVKHTIFQKETQEKNIQELLPLLPKRSHDYSSPLAPIVAFDRGYGKMSIILTFLER
jgi:hypothetical protein